MEMHIASRPALASPRFDWQTDELIPICRCSGLTTVLLDGGSGNLMECERCGKSVCVRKGQPVQLWAGMHGTLAESPEMYLQTTRQLYDEIIRCTYGVNVKQHTVIHTSLGSVEVTQVQGGVPTALREL